MNTFGNGVTGLDMGDIEVASAGGSTWYTLTAIDALTDTNVVDFMDNGDGTYSFVWDQAFDTGGPLDVRASGVVIETNMLVTITGNPTIDADTSNVTATDQLNGTTLIEVEVLDTFGNGIVGLGMADIEVADAGDTSWYTLTDIDALAFFNIIDFTDNADGTYSFIWDFDEDVSGDLDVRVKDVLIATNVFIEVTGSPTIDADASGATATDQSDGTTRLEITIVDSFGNGVSDAGMTDIEASFDDSAYATLAFYHALPDHDITLTDNFDGTYDVIWDYVIDLNVFVSIRVNNVVIEAGLPFVITGN